VTCCAASRSKHKQFAARHDSVEADEKLLLLAQRILAEALQDLQDEVNHKHAALQLAAGGFTSEAEVGPAAGPVVGVQAESVTKNVVSSMPRASDAVKAVEAARLFKAPLALGHTATTKGSALALCVHPVGQVVNIGKNTGASRDVATFSVDDLLASSPTDDEGAGSPFRLTSTIAGNSSSAIIGPKAASGHKQLLPMDAIQPVTP